MTVVVVDVWFALFIYFPPPPPLFPPPRAPLPGKDPPIAGISRRLPGKGGSVAADIAAAFRKRCNDL